MTTFNHGHAFIVGVTAYPNVPHLPPTLRKDGKDLSALLTDRSACGYRPDHVKHLVDKQATAANIRAELSRLTKQVKPEDTVLITFSGYGGHIESGPQAGNYLFPFDVDPARFGDTVISGQELTNLLQNIQTRRLVVLLDCNHSTAIVDNIKSLQEMIPGFKAGFSESYLDQLAGRLGGVIIAAADSTETAWVVPGIRNSLFFHYFLEALRGEAQSYGDGLIRILDIFNFIAEEMPKRKQQHPILKGDVKTNFPLALAQEKNQPDRQLIQPLIEQPATALPGEATAVLKTMFADYRRVVVEKEFTPDCHNHRIFLIHPVDEHETVAPLTIVKMAPVSHIEQEWQSYQHFVRNRLPSSLGVGNKPVLPAGYWGGLCYPLISNGTLAIQSLYHYFQQASLEDIRFVLTERLLQITKRVMQFHHSVSNFSLAAGYDAFLPVNLLVQPLETIPNNAEPRLVRPDRLPDQPLKRGDLIRLEGFVVTDVDLLNDTVTLNLPKPAEGFSTSYRLRLAQVSPLANFEVNTFIDNLVGEVIESRSDRLEAAARYAFDDTFNPNQETLTLTNEIELPNPLLRLTGILGRQCRVKVGYILGDLRLENILVNPKSRDVTLVNFTQAREDYILHEFLRLETEIVTRLIPEILAQTRLSTEILPSFYRQLHQAMFEDSQLNAGKLIHFTLEKPFIILTAIRQAASDYLADPNDWSEYYQGLMIYLLGAMTSENLDQRSTAPASISRQTALLGAATAADLLDAVTKSKKSHQHTKQRKLELIKSKRNSKLKGMHYRGNLRIA